MKKQEDTRKGQLNNEGFSLLEVLIAIVILAIVSIPLLHSFVTAAKTNARAKIMLRATTAAENLMEDFKYLTLEELQNKYGVSSQNTVAEDTATGIYTFTLKNQDDFSQKLPDGYSVTVKLDPTLYPNANALNLSNFSTVSAADSAVYTMSKAYDQNAYEEFVDRNKKANSDNSLLYAEKTADYFKENLTRVITVSITKTGTATDDLGDEVDLVNVSMKITYELKNYSGILYAADRKYEAASAELYNNTVTKTKLASIFIFYNPRYKAAQHNGDNIIVENIDNIKANLYVVAQDGADDENLRSSYLSTTNGLRLTVIEEPAGGGFTAETQGALTLRTNLNSGAPYSGLSTEADGEIQCALTYQNLRASKKAQGTLAQSILQAGDIDGKSLQKDQTKTRIYKMTTTVQDDKSKTIVSLDGTRLNES